LGYIKNAVSIPSIPVNTSDQSGKLTSC